MGLQDTKGTVVAALLEALWLAFASGEIEIVNDARPLAIEPLLEGAETDDEMPVGLELDGGEDADDIVEY